MILAVFISAYSQLCFLCIVFIRLLGNRRIKQGRYLIYVIAKITLEKNQPKNIRSTIDLVLIDQQSVGKRILHLMDTFNAKKRWTTIYWRVNFLKESHE
jgi:hypothetical protein